MGYKSGDQELLNTIAERMSNIVDPALRQRLSGLYLGLLTEYNNRRMGPNFHNRVAALWAQVRAGLTQYKLWPGLGTIHGQFYDSLDSALAVLDRMDRVVTMQRNPEVRRQWAGEANSFRFMLNRLADSAQMASTNVNLSLLDSLAVQVAGITAVQLIPRLVRWSQAVKQVPPTFLPTGEHASMVMAAVPDLMIRPEGLGEAASGFLKLSAGVRDRGQVRGHLQEADRLYAAFKTAVLRVKGLGARLNLRERKVQTLALARKYPTADWLSRLAEQRRELGSVEAVLRDIAGRLKSVTYDLWDEPLAHLRAELGMLSEQRGAAVLLFGEEIKGAINRLAALEREVAGGDQELPGGEEEGKAAALFGLGLGALALLG